MSRVFKASLLLMSVLSLAACGFHLRQNVALPPAMQHVHVTVNNNNNLLRGLERTLAASGITVEEKAGVDIAELNVPAAYFSTDTLTVNGAARVTEYTVRYQVQFEVHDGAGQPLVPRQRIDLQRDFSYDPTNTIGTSAQVEAIQGSLNDDMVTAILLRLQAAGRHPGQTAAAAAAQEAAPPAQSTQPASSSSTH
ncbi:LPS assembly lipoprotein LptE [Dyella terrae]|uniref:LPS-assembly lipoprotein LptE n=1 Tax=Dyella terrae TaxID=522259 RepID=UPI001EFD67D1|nr:LPS assembly lipoprotein LptE [Dyella terrae]ULU24847.1 Lipopolysaccharide-assembly protein [Dyella terrae]